MSTALDAAARIGKESVSIRVVRANRCCGVVQERVGNNGADNSQANLVLCVNDVLHSDTGKYVLFPPVLGCGPLAGINRLLKLL